MDSTVAVIGGGPAGACFALLLSRKGYKVHVYEKRSDPRQASSQGSHECVSRPPQANAPQRG